MPGQLPVVEESSRSSRMLPGQLPVLEHSLTGKLFESSLRGTMIGGRVRGWSIHQEEAEGKQFVRIRVRPSFI